MRKATKWFSVGALAATGVLAFACGGGSSESGGATTPTSASASATPPAASSVAQATSASASASAATPPAPPLTVSPMKLTSVDGKHVIELKEDGSILADGKPVAKITGAELQDKDGKTLVAVLADSTVKVAGGDKPAKFSEKDELVLPDGAKMFVADDGTVKLFNPDGKPDKDSGKLKLTGFKPTARRAATVFVVTMMLSQPPQSTPATSASASGPAAKPPAKK